jgi:ribosomal protein S18 acetylase RimI-like enzyme
MSRAVRDLIHAQISCPRMQPGVNSDRFGRKYSSQSTRRSLAPVSSMRALHNAPFPVWSRRPSTPADLEFLYQLFSSTRDDEMALWGAPADQQAAFLRMQFDAQRAHYGRHFSLAGHEIITIDGEPVGRILVDRSRGELRLVDIALLPEHRGSGIGSVLVRELLDESVATGKPVRVHAFKPSRAVDFYERLGFRRIADEGVYWELEAAP